MKKNYDDYVVFILGRSFLNDYLPYEDDLAYDICVAIAKDYEKSEFNRNTRSLYECVQEYISQLFEDLDKIPIRNKADKLDKYVQMRGLYND